MLIMLIMFIMFIIIGRIKYLVRWKPGNRNLNIAVERPTACRFPPVGVRRVVFSLSTETWTRSLWRIEPAPGGNSKGKVIFL